MSRPNLDMQLLLDPSPEKDPAPEPIAVLEDTQQPSVTGGQTRSLVEPGWNATALKASIAELQIQHPWWCPECTNKFKGLNQSLESSCRYNLKVQNKLSIWVMRIYWNCHILSVPGLQKMGTNLFQSCTLRTVPTALFAWNTEITSLMLTRMQALQYMRKDRHEKDRPRQICLYRNKPSSDV
jgi:hypothetical protein